LYNGQEDITVCRGTFGEYCDLAESEAEFARFLMKMPSLKHKLIYYLIKLSALIKIDVVSPMTFLKERLRKILSGKVFLQRQ